MIGVPLGIVLLPTLSRERGRAAETSSRRSARALRLLVFVMVPIAGLGDRAANETSALLFGHGQITVATVDATAAALGALLLGLVAHSMIAVLARAFYARQDTRTPVGAALVAVVIDCVLAVILSGQFGLPGIGLAIAIGGLGRGARPARHPAGRLQELRLRGLGLTRCQGRRRQRRSSAASSRSRSTAGSA